MSFFNSISDAFNSGGVWMWFILALQIVAVAIIVERFVALYIRRKPTQKRRVLGFEKEIRQGQLESVLTRSTADGAIPINRTVAAGTAIEAALAIRDALDRGGLRVNAAKPDDTKTKIKFDRQIVAIAKAEGAHTVYTDDESMAKYAERAKLQGIRTADLDLPPEDPQQALDLDNPEE